MLTLFLTAVLDVIKLCWGIFDSFFFSSRITISGQGKPCYLMLMVGLRFYSYKRLTANVSQIILLTTCILKQLMT